MKRTVLSFIFLSLIILFVAACTNPGQLSPPAPTIITVPTKEAQPVPTDTNMVPTATYASQPTETIISPEDHNITIDGIISPGEWQAAETETFSDSSELLILQNGTTLFLAIRANTAEMIAGNVFIEYQGQVKILHVSAALGTAIYQQDGDLWQQTKAFDWCCRGTLDSDQTARATFLQQDGWVSINSRVGTPNELEYQIEIEEKSIHLAVNFIIATSNPDHEKIYWPVNLEDDVRLPTPGGFPTEFQFQPDQWSTLQISGKNENGSNN